MIVVGFPPLVAKHYKTTTMRDALMPSMQAFSAANGGQTPKNLADLLPYVTTPDQQTALQNLSQTSSSGTQ